MSGKATQEVTLRVPATKKSASTPFICYTDPASSIAVPDANLPGFAIGAFTKVDNPKKRAFGVSNERTAATAKNYGKNQVPKLEKFFVFALQEGEAVLVNKLDADGAFTLKKEISDEAAAAGAASYAPPPIAQASSQRERHAQLEENFGSRKRRKTQKKLSMAAISSDRVVNSEKLGDTLEKFLTKAGDNEDQGEGDSTVSSNLKFLLPPFDEKAETPQEAYPLAGYFLPEDRPAVQEAMNKEDLYFESKFANSRFNRSSNPEQKKLAAYFECLFRFHVKVRGFVAGPAEACKAMNIGNDRLADSLLRRFTEAQPVNLGGGWGKTRLLKDRLLINMLIVALALDGFRISTSAVKAIADDLKVEIAVLVPLLFKVGCRITSEGASEKMYELKVPLKFVEERRRGQRRKG